MNLDRVLVTGAGGFLGRYLCAALRQRNALVTALDLKYQVGPWDRFVTADITAPIPTSAFDGISVVFHLAGKAHSLAEVEQDKAEYFKINTEGTRNVLVSAREAGVRRFVLFSTIKAMSQDAAGWENAGSWKRMPTVQNVVGPFTESDELEPDTAYGQSKRAAEKLVLANDGYLEPVVLRLCMVYGAGAKGNIDRIINAVRRRIFPPPPAVENRRSMVHAEDVAHAALLAAERPDAVGQIFIVSDGEAYSTRRIYDGICRALGRRTPRWGFPMIALRALARFGDLAGNLAGRRFPFDSDAWMKLFGSAWFSSDKIRNLLGFKSIWTLEKALPQMLDPAAGAISIQGDHPL